MEAGRPRALVRVLVTARKQKEKDGASTSAPNIVSKGTSKRKNEGKDDCPLKKRLGTLVGTKQPKLTAIYTLNQELTAKTKVLAEETRRFEEAEKAKTNLATELAFLREQMEKAKVDAMVKFRASQSFINACAVYYADRFENCLKQVGSIYPNLDLSKVSIDDLLLTTPAASDTVNKEFDDSAYTEERIPIDDGVVIAQPVPEGHIATSVPSVEDPSAQDAQNPAAQDA